MSTAASPARPRRISRARILGAILRKDVTLFARDWLFLGLTVFSMAVFIGLYFILPAEVDQTISLAVRGQQLEPAFQQLAGEQAEGQALGISFYATTGDLRESVEAGRSEVGIDFPDGFIRSVRAGEPVTVTLYTRANLPRQVNRAVSTMVREIALALAGDQLPVVEPDEQSVIVGPRIGPVPLRDQLKPLYAFMILIMEALSLGTLIASEIQQRTATAILVTPASTSDLLISKAVLGTIIAFSEAVLVMVVIRGLGPEPLIVIFAVFLGAVLVTGIAMIAGSAGKDLVGTMLLGMLFLVPLAVPAFSVLFPGSPAAWVTWIPTYGLVSAVRSASLFHAGWAEVGADLLSLGAWGIAILVVGALILKGRVHSL